MLLVLFITSLAFSTIYSAAVNRYPTKTEYHDGTDKYNTNINDVRTLFPCNDKINNLNQNLFNCPTENGFVSPKFRKTEKRNAQFDNSIHEDYPTDYYDCPPNCFTIKDSKSAIDTIFDRDKVNILKWAANQLKSLYNLNGSGHSDFHNIKKFNLSGRREGPLYAEEPKFVVIRREQDFNQNMGGEFLDDPFIPPRGRKHIPELQKLMERYDLFVPNRGKKDKIKDIFKYEDLFFPNRGKKAKNGELVNYKTYI